MKRSSGMRRRSSIAAISLSALTSPQPSRLAIIVRVEPEDVAGLADQPVLPERGDVLLAEPLDVEAVARRRNASAARPPARRRSARRCSAAPPCPPRAPRGCRRPGNGRGTHRARHRAGGGRARPPTICGITSPARCTMTVSPIRTSLRADLVLVVQGGALHDDAADRHRLQHRDRGQRALPADRDHDVAHHGLRLLGGEFVRDRPARRAAAHAEPALQCEVVDLVDDAVDVVGQLGARASPISR